MQCSPSAGGASWGALLPRRLSGGRPGVRLGTALAPPPPPPPAGDCCDGCRDRGGVWGTSAGADRPAVLPARLAAVLAAGVEALDALGVLLWVISWDTSGYASNGDSSIVSCTHSDNAFAPPHCKHDLSLVGLW